MVSTLVIFMVNSPDRGKLVLAIHKTTREFYHTLIYRGRQTVLQGNGGAGEQLDFQVCTAFTNLVLPVL